MNFTLATTTKILIPLSFQPDVKTFYFKYELFYQLVYQSLP